MNPLLKGFKSATRPPEPFTPWQWCEKHVVVDDTSPMSGRWRSDNAPWVREFMEVFADNRVRQITVKCSAQSSKTQTIINLLCWLIAEDPGPVLWLGAAADELKVFVSDRVDPTFRNCEPVMSVLQESSKLRCSFATCPVYFAGAHSRSKVKSKPVRYLLGDEVEEYPPGNLQNAMSRTVAYDNWNSRKVLISTPHLKGGVMDVEFLKGDQRVFHAVCPECGTLQPLKWEQMKWDKTEETCKEGKWDFVKLSETVRFECSGKDCKHRWKDTPAERKQLARSGKFVRLNPTAPPWRVSFSWNAILPPWVTWISLVEEFINAENEAKTGSTEDLKSFINDRLGEPWEDRLGNIDDWGFLEARKADYDFGEEWPEETDRFISADRQEYGGEHYRYVVRAVGPFGKSRLLAYGRASNTAELEELRKKFNIPLPNAMVDSGWKASEVYRFCLSSGWKPFKGDDCEYFLHRDQKSEKVVRRIWEKTFVDPFLGTKLAGRSKPMRMYRFSSSATKDLLADYMTGLTGDWAIPEKVGREYLRQITAERRREVTNSKGKITRVWERKDRENHYFDCEQMILIACLVKGYVGQKDNQKPST